MEKNRVKFSKSTVALSFVLVSIWACGTFVLITQNIYLYISLMRSHDFNALLSWPNVKSLFLWKVLKLNVRVDIWEVTKEDCVWSLTTVLRGMVLIINSLLMRSLQGLNDCTISSTEKCRNASNVIYSVPLSQGLTIC